MKTVYFIKPIGMDGPVKIGVSVSPDGRRETLETWSPFPLEVVAEIAGDERLEMSFHARFRSQHSHREWFHSSPELDQVMAEIRAGTFDPETLPDPKRLGYRSVQRPPHFAKQLSYSLRVGHLSRKTGYDCPVSVYGIIERDDALAISFADAFLADPFKYGVPNPYRCGA